MRRAIQSILLAFVLVFGAGAVVQSAHAEEETPSVGRTLFVVETDGDTARESLHRVSGGDIDLGFSGGSQSYESEHHNPTGPFDRSI